MREPIDVSRTRRERREEKRGSHVVVRKVVLEWSVPRSRKRAGGWPCIGRGKEETEGNWPALSAHLTPSPALEEVNFKNISRGGPPRPL